MELTYHVNNSWVSSRAVIGEKTSFDINYAKLQKFAVETLYFTTVRVETQKLFLQHIQLECFII